MHSYIFADENGLFCLYEGRNGPTEKALMCSENALMKGHGEDEWRSLHAFFILLSYGLASLPTHSNILHHKPLSAKRFFIKVKDVKLGLLDSNSGMKEQGTRQIHLRILRDSCPKKGVYFTIPLEFLMKLMILCISSLIGTWSSIFCKASCTLKFPWYTRR